ncbi:MAG: chorismate synthase [Thermoguttaceae bacterium]
MRWLTAGESHGKCLTAIVTGFPSGVDVDVAQINAALARRQGGYGRSVRQTIERDEVAITSGVWRGKTTGAPITFTVANRDATLESRDELRIPRPGHADLAGAMKYRSAIRPILERASARETAVVVAVGALCQQLLNIVGVDVVGYVTAIGDVSLTRSDAESLAPDQLRVMRDASELYSLSSTNDQAVKSLIDQCRHDGDSLGGVAEVRVFGLPFGLGSHTQWDEKLDGLLAQSVMAIQSVKGVEIGLGCESARRRGSQVHDPIVPLDGGEPRCCGLTRPTNNAGGIEGGMSNTMPVVVRAAFKPIPTMTRSLPSVDLKTQEATKAFYERSDVCAVSAASVVAEAVVATTITSAYLKKFSGDSISEIQDMCKS